MVMPRSRSIVLLSIARSCAGGQAGQSVTRVHSVSGDTQVCVLRWHALLAVSQWQQSPAHKRPAPAPRSPAAGTAPA
jgi:hypothetical protein